MPSSPSFSSVNRHKRVEGRTPAWRGGVPLRASAAGTRNNHDQVFHDRLSAHSPATIERAAHCTPQPKGPDSLPLSRWQPSSKQSTQGPIVPPAGGGLSSSRLLLADTRSRPTSIEPSGLGQLLGVLLELREQHSQHVAVPF